VNVRQARPSDSARLHELHTGSVRTLCSPYYTPDVIDGWLLNRRPESYLPEIERGDLFVVEQGVDVVGFGSAARGMIIAVYVDPDAIKQGVGSAIMRHGLEIARRGHDGPIRLEATLNAARFYERFGFHEVARSSVRRGDTAIAVILMERRDG
jgi:GNAT superfamily N-acetyltransferase